MPPAAKGPNAVLQSMRGRLVSLARRLARLTEEASPIPSPPDSMGENPIAPLFDVLDSFDTEHLRFHSRLMHLENAGSTDPAQSYSPHRDPLGPLFDALDSINSELCGFAARLTQLEDTGSHERPGMPALVICPKPGPAAVHRSRQAGKAVDDA